MRVEATELVGDQVQGELVPLVFPCKDTKGEKVKMAAMAHIPHLWGAIKSNLDQNEDESRGYVNNKFENYRYFNTTIFSISRLTWHDGAIPEEEIWLKIGGDKGGGTFKMSFQVANIPNPNSPENTIVFSMFEAPDSYTNLSITLQPYIEQINELKTTEWRCCKPFYVYNYIH